MTARDESRSRATEENAATVAVSVLPVAQRRTLARCALVSGFDEAMYQAVLRAPAGPPLADLVKELTLEPQPGVRGDYRIAPSLRAAAWRRWWPDGATHGAVPDELVTFAADVARYCQEAERPLEVLRALAVSDEQAAAAWFERLYRQHDEAFDLTGCRNLLDVLYKLSEPEHVPPLSQQLVPLRNDRTQYLNARYLWHGAWLGSARYLSRPRVEADLLELLEPYPARRALRLHGSGGMGKSMTLRWFLARHCVPEPRQLPCALVDLDVIDPVNATKHPWLVLLEIAGQLNVQMAGAPFQELLREHGLARELLRPTQEDLARSGAAAVASAAAPVDVEDVRSRFFAALEDAEPSAVPIVVALDTFEDAVLQGMDPAPLVAVLADLHDASPRIRLVVSGRLTGEEEQRLPALHERLPEALMPDRGFPPFSATEAREYLTEVRDVSDELVDVIIRRAEGLPWRLALFADYLQHFPDATRETLDGVDPALAYVIDRIVGRIPSEALQWLVRYAVVARRHLRRHFAEQVLLPRVAAGLRGTVDDRPDQGLPTGSVPVFQSAAMPPPQEVWHDLLRYAAGFSSWIQPAQDDPESVILHPSVVQPLRRLLARQPVYILLHQDATRYYDGLARQDPSHWPTWTKEALYHRFQAADPDAGEAWRRAVAHAHDAGRFDWVGQLAEEILGPDYHTDAEAIDAGLRAEALVERAWGTAQQARGARLPGADPRWSVVEHSLDQARELAEGDSRIQLAETRWRSAGAALHLARAEYQQAVEVIEPLTDSTEVSTDRCRALMLCSEALRALERHDESTARLHSARQVARQLGDRETLARIALMLCDDAVSRWRYDEAQTWAGTAMAEDPAGGLCARGRITQAALMLRLGRPATAARLADVPPAEDPALEHAELHAQALLALGRPQAALRVCAQARAVGSGRRDRDAALLLAQGRAAAELLMIDEALDSLLSARAIYSRLKDQEHAALCSVEAAGVHLRAVGNLKEARQYLDEAMRFTVAEGAAAWARCWLLRAELDHRLGVGDTAASTCLRVLRAVEDRHADPELVVAAAVTGLVIGGPPAGDFSRSLRATLAAVTPASARLALLGDLTRCPGRLEVASDLLDLVHKYQSLPAEDETWQQDEQWLALREAEVRRLAGRDLAPAHAAFELARTDDHALWLWLQLMERAGPAGADEPVPVPEGFASVPLLHAVWEVVLAGRRMAIDPPEVSEGRLHRATELMDVATTRKTHWHARLHIAYSRLEARRGAHHQATMQARTAAAVYGELGDEAQAARLAPDLAPPHHAEDPGWPQLDLHISAKQGGEWLSVRAEGQTVLRVPHSPLLAGTLSAASTRSQVVRLLNRAVTGGELVRVPGLGELLTRAADVPCDVRLTFESPLLAPLPWELVTTSEGPLAADGRVRCLYRAPAGAQADRVQTRSLQRALARAGLEPGPADGLLGPMTRLAIERLQREVGGDVDGVAGLHTWEALRGRLRERRERPRVLVLRRDTASELTVRRGKSLEGYELEDLYREAGFEVTEIRVHLGEQLLPWKWITSPVDVLHISTTMESSGSVPILDFGSATYGSEAPWVHGRAETLAVTALDRLVAELSRVGRTPLVVLDVSRPGGISETTSQLLLRNDFAHQLVGLGGVETVVATGLAAPGESEEASRVLVHGLAEGDTAAQVAGRLQHRDRRTALFSAVLPDTMMPLGT